MSEEMIAILRDKNYSHFFIDGTFSCIPAGYLKNKNEKEIYFTIKFLKSGGRTIYRLSWIQ